MSMFGQFLCIEMINTGPGFPQGCENTHQVHHERNGVCYLAP